MDFYLPPEEDSSRLDDTYDRAIGGEVLDQVNELLGEEDGSARIDKIFPVSFESFCAWTLIVRARTTTVYAHMRWCPRQCRPRRYW